jgi:hypothetical protein
VSAEYQTAREQNPPVWPGPQHYWKEKPVPKGKKRKTNDKSGRADMYVPPKEEYKVEENGKINYYYPRRRTDVFLSKPMKSHIF